MKKYFLVLALLSGFTLSAFDHGLITGFKVGYSSNNGVTIFNEDKSSVNNISYDDTYDIELKMGYRLGNFRFIGTYLNTLGMEKIDSYYPLQDRYTVEASFTFGNFKVGGIHSCCHSIKYGTSTREKYLDMSIRQFYIAYYKEF